MSTTLLIFGNKFVLPHPVSGYGWTQRKKMMTLYHIGQVKTSYPFVELIFLKTLMCESESANDDDHEDLNEMSADTDSCAKDSYEGFLSKW